MENRLREIIISITNRCNLRCAMCQIPETGNKSEMTTQELKDLIIDAVKISPNSIVFSGGEPLLRKDIFELISFTNRHRINTCLTSNGNLISDDVAKRLSSSGIGVVNVSIEGPENIHDFLRSRGSFKKAVEGLKNLFHYKIETTIATVVCRQNYKSLPYVMELARQFGITTVKFQPFNEIFLMKKDEKKNFFAPQEVLKDIGESIEKIIELAKKYKIATNPINYLRIIPMYLCGLWQKYPYNHNDCSALWTSCPISADGNVYLCWVLSNKPLGNVKNIRLYNIWNSDEHIRLRHLVIKEGCPGCLMSCYDYNFGKDDPKQILSLKARKIIKPKFYKRQYYRIYQYLKYILKKIVNRLVNLILFYINNNSNTSDALKEIKLAKDMLKSKLIILEEYEKR